MTWLHLFAPGRSNHKEILLAWETWWKSAACGKSSVQRSSCFLATIPTPRFAKCFWMGGLSEFWSLFGEDHGPYYGPWSQIFKTHRNLPKPCKIWKIWKSLENTFNFKYRGTLPFENNKATFRLLNLKAPNLHGLFKALDLYSEIWNSQYLEGKTNKARFYMVGKDTPDFQSCTRGGGAVHSFLEIAVLSSLDFSKTGHSTPGKKSKPDINPLGLFQIRTFGPWKKIKTGHQTAGNHTRTLDAELRAHVRATSKDWDWQKLSFILEEQGKVQDDEITKAQSRTNSALLNSLTAGYSLFTTNLENDQLSFKRWQLASSGDEAKARAAVVSSLEELGFKKTYTQTHV